jgi:preprotein translocase subunit Sec61beta
MSVILMAEGIGMPSSYGGLMRYYDEYKSKLQIKPVYVVFFVALFAIIEIILTKVNSA